jgi:hypothetical protein
MNWSKQLFVGCRVSYSDVNLWQAKGVLLAIQRGPHGADCLVQWDRNPVMAWECQANLVSWA